MQISKTYKGDDLIRSYITKRMIQGVALVFAVSILVFGLLYMMPGNPVDMMVDRKVSAEKKAEIAHEMGYDRPMIEQYCTWVKKIVTKLDFGTSTRYKSPVWDLMKERIPLSLTLCGIALLLEMVIALPIGLLCAIKKDTLFDRSVVGITLLMTAVPGFWLCALLIIVFSVTLGWLPISGYRNAENFILPVCALVFSSLAGSIRLTKSEVLEVMNEKYVTTARAKGLPERTVMVKHVLRNALIVVTVQVFMSIPWLISGAVVVERLFGIPGMGNLMLNSIVVQDFPVVQGCMLLISILTVICNLVSDIVIGILDPRIRESMAGGA